MVAHAYEQRQNWFHQSTILFLVMSCSFSSICGNECGAAANNPTDSSVVSLKSCNKDVTNYLRTLGVSEKRGQHATSHISEEDLIVNTAGLFDCACSADRTDFMTIWGVYKTKTEDRRPKTEDRRPKTEDRRPKTEDRRPKTEDRRPKIEDRRPKNEELINFRPFKLKAVVIRLKYFMGRYHTRNRLGLRFVV